MKIKSNDDVEVEMLQMSRSEKIEILEKFIISNVSDDYKKRQSCSSVHYVCSEIIYNTGRSSDIIVTSAIHSMNNLNKLKKTRKELKKTKESLALEKEHVEIFKKEIKRLRSYLLDKQNELKNKLEEIDILKIKINDPERTTISFGIGCTKRIVARVLWPGKEYATIHSIK